MAGSIQFGDLDPEELQQILHCQPPPLLAQAALNDVNPPSQDCSLTPDHGTRGLWSSPVNLQAWRPAATRALHTSEEGGLEGPPVVAGEDLLSARQVPVITSGITTSTRCVKVPYSKLIWGGECLTTNAHFVVGYVREVYAGEGSSEPKWLVDFGSDLGV